jgi:cytochrome bd-type quinol oxidase subunit 2
LRIVARATGADRQVALGRTAVVRQRLCTQYTQALVLAYHADAEADRALAIAAAVTLLILAAFTLWLAARAPRRPDRRAVASIATFALVGLAAAAYAALWALDRGQENPEEPPFWWWAIFVAFAGGALLSPLPAFKAYARREGRLAGVAVGLSLLFPALYVAGYVSCAFTDACFH